MLLKLDDGKVVFATYFLRCTVNREDERVRETLASFQVEADGIVCYSQEEAGAVQAVLDNMGIPYTVELQAVPQAVVDRATGMRYGSRSEALQHLTFLGVSIDLNPVAAGEVALVTATLYPPTPLDAGVRFQVEGGEPIDEPVSGGQASHAYAFAQPGVYRVTVSSQHHGSAVVEVIVQ